MTSYSRPPMQIDDVWLKLQVGADLVNRLRNLTPFGVQQWPRRVIKFDKMSNALSA